MQAISHTIRAKYHRLFSQIETSAVIARSVFRLSLARSFEQDVNRLFCYVFFLESYFGCFN